MTLEAKLKVIREKLKEDDNFRRSEASVSQGIVLPILRELNWDTDDTRVVRPEHSPGEGMRADFALCDGDNPKVFIEVKKLGGVKGMKNKEVTQLMLYAHSAHVPIVVLTDGRTWSFYLPGEEGIGFEGKQVSKPLDILEQSPQESSEILQRYLEKSRVVLGEALETARVNFFLEKNLKSGLQWETMVDDAIAKFSTAHGFLAGTLVHEIKPKSDQDNIAHDIVDYFHSLLRQKISPSPSSSTARRTQPESGRQGSPPPSPGASERKQPVHRRVRQASASPSSGQRQEGQVPAPPGQKVARVRVRIKKLVIFRRRYSCRSQSHAMALVFKKLQKEDPEFLQRFYEHPQNQREGGRRYLGRNLQELFGNNVGSKTYESIGRGWVISTYYNWPDKKDIIQLAADVAGLKLKFEEDSSGKSASIIID